MKRLIMAALFTSILSGGAFAISESAKALFQKGVETWDSTPLQAALAQADAENPSGDFLFKATVLWRLQVIAYLANDKQAMVRLGKRALALLDSADRSGEDRYILHARRAYVCQLMAVTSIKNGAIYGPQTAKHLDEMKKIRKNGFEVRFIGAVNLLEMPSFVGGDYKKALDSMRVLFREFPDSAEVAINLARALFKNKQKEQASVVIEELLRKEPKNAWARKVREEIK